MRRVIAISLAILVLAIGARGVMAQDAEQDFNHRLLEILKDRQLISEETYSEMKDLAVQMDQERGDLDARVEGIDSDIAEYLYLSQGGDARGANVSHKKGDGFGLSTGDGFFSLWIGGLFQAWYTGADNEDARDTNSIAVKQARIDLSGNAFNPNLTYRFEVNLGTETGQGGVLDLWANWDFMQGAQIRFGQMKVPYGRQWSTYQGDLEFGVRSPVTTFFAPGWDLGVMLWDEVAVRDGDEPMFDWYAGVFNGDGPNVAANDNNWMAVLLRASVSPLGYVDYTEGDFDQSKTKVAFGASYYYTQNRPGGTTVKMDNWAADGVVKWNGLFGELEYFYQNMNIKGMNRIVNWGWYAQAGYMVPNSSFEVFGNYGFISWDGDTGLDETWNWAAGVAYYFEGHPFKVLVYFAQNSTDDGKKFVSGVLPPFGSPAIMMPGDTSTLNVAFQLDW